MSAGHDTRLAIMDRIAELLAIEEPVIGRVYRGDRGRINPGLPSGGPYATFWYAGESEKQKTLGNVMVQERFGIRCYWPRVAEEEPIQSQELDVWDASRNIQAAFRADSTLSGKATDLEISQVDVGWVGTGGAADPMYRVLEFELLVDNYEAEAIGVRQVA